MPTPQTITFSTGDIDPQTPGAMSFALSDIDPTDIEQTRPAASTPAAVIPVNVGGRGTGLDVRKSDEFGSGFASLIPFSGASAPNTWRGHAGQAAAVGALLANPITRIGEAAASGGLTAGVKQAVTQAAPWVKYEATRSTLRALHVPDTIAIPIAAVVSGTGSRKVPGIVAQSADAEAVTPAVNPSGPAIASSAPAANTAIPGIVARVTPSPQMIRNAVGLAARRANLALSDQQLAVADVMVSQHGVSPADAVATVAQATGANGGDAVSAAQALAQKFALPSTSAVQQAVTQRNATGGW